MKLGNPYLIAILFLALSAAPIIALGANNTTTTTATTAQNATATPSLSNILSTALSNPQAAAVVLIEFALGFALGYTAVKALKYILSFIGILILGSALSVWSLGSNSEEIIRTLGAQMKEALPAIKKLITAFSFMVVGPASAGLIVGVIVAMMNK